MLWGVHVNYEAALWTAGAGVTTVHIPVHDCIRPHLLLYVDHQFYTLLLPKKNVFDPKYIDSYRDGIDMTTSKS